MIHATFAGLYAIEAKNSHQPVLIIQDGRVIDYNSSAGRLGVARAKNLTESLRLAPDAHVIDFNPHRHKKWIGVMRDVLREWTPWLNIPSDQEWYAAFYSDSPRDEWQRLFHRLMERLPGQGWVGFSGLAGRSLTAETISLRIAEEGLRAFSPGSRMAVPPVFGAWVEDDAKFIRRLPLRFIRPIPPQIKEELERLGVHTGEQLIKISPDTLQRKFGSEAFIWQHFAAGEPGDSFVPRDPGKTLFQTWAAPPGETVPIGSSEPLLDLLCDALVHRLEKEQFGTQRIALQSTDDEGGRAEEQYVFTEVCARPERIRRAARELIVRLRSRYPGITRISELRLTAWDLHPLRGEQMSWFLRENEFFPPFEFRRQTWRFLIEELKQKYPGTPIRFGSAVSWENQRQAWWDPWQHDLRAFGSPPNFLKDSRLPS